MIPRTIHHVWVGDLIPDALQACVDTWRDLHPEWEHLMWDEDAIRGLGLVNGDLFDRAEEITPHVGQFRADLARYEILHAFGGVYVDCDMEARKPLDPLLHASCFAAWEDRRWVNNAVLGCVPGHRLMADAVAAIPGSVERNKGKRPNVLTGPQMLTPLVRDDVTVHPTEWFYPYKWDDLDGASRDYPDAYAIHHWANRRKRDGVPFPEVAHA